MLLEADSNTPENAYVPPLSRRNEIILYVVIAVGVIYVIVSLYLMHDMRTRLTAMEKKQQTLEVAQVALGDRMHETSSQFKEALSLEVGMTKQELARRAEELDRQQKAAAAKLAAAQSQQGKQIAAVSGEVSGVKTDVGTAKTDIQRTQTDLAATNAKLERTIGDLGVQSGLIAHTAAELEALKRKGDRNYYDFTLQKGARTPVSTISLQLKKVGVKSGKIPVNLMADAPTIEKKDRTIGEPLQFYTGRDRMLYEVVVFTAAKNTITGYLATPKTAPTPVTP